MFIDKVLFSSEKTNWETPTEFFDELNAEFHFELDAASSDENAKCLDHYTIEDDGLAQDWGDKTVFVNPPYGRNITGKWVEKAYKQHQKHGNTIVMLIPARTDTKWFHEYIYGKAEIRFIKGRLKFEIDKEPMLDNNGRPSSAPFPSMVCIYRG